MGHADRPSKDEENNQQMIPTEYNRLGHPGDPQAEGAVGRRSDLAALYSVETKVLLQAVKRNRERFPDDFMFQLTEEGLLEEMIVKHQTRRIVSSLSS